MMRTSGSVSRLALAVAGLLVVPATALAQSSPPPVSASPPADTQDSGALQDIVVTAQKRSENLQNVPISITAVTAETVKAAGVGGTLDIGIITPGLTETKTGNAPLLFLRGVGTALGGTPGDEGGVNLVVDGVVYTSLPGSVLSLNNIERIEVLRGPQGTLFGRNSAGGVVSIITRDPSQTTSADFSLGYANYDTLSASGYVTGGVTDTVAVDLAAQYSKQSQGYGINLYNGKDVNLSRDFSIRSKIVWKPGPDTTIRLSGDYDDARGDQGVARQILPGTVSSLGQVGPPGFYNVDENLQPDSRLKTYGGSLKIDQALSFAQLTSITAYRKSDSSFDFDQDAGPIQLVDATFVNRERQLTEEFQIASLSTSRIKWIVGFFYLDSDAKETPLTLSGLAFGPALFDARYGDIGTKSYAGYGQTTVPLGETTNITAGVRYTSDHRSFVFNSTSGLGIPLEPSANTSATFNKATWRVAVDQKLTDDILAYASISTGFKAGSFNIINPSNPPILPENLTSYEAGIKSELFDKHLRLNASGFYYDYKNIQVNQILENTTFFLNAPGEVYGGDVDFEARLFSGFTLSGGFEALHSEYKNFPNAPGSLPLPAVCGPNGPVAVPGPPAGGNIVCPFNAQGNQLVRAPDLTTSLTAAYKYPTSIGDFGISVTYAHSASFPWEIDGRLRQNPTDLVNGQFSFFLPKGQAGVRLWVRNLTDQHYYLQESSSLGDTGAPAAPRTFGGTVEVHF